MRLQLALKSKNDSYFRATLAAILILELSDSLCSCQIICSKNFRDTNPWFFFLAIFHKPGYQKTAHEGISQYMRQRQIRGELFVILSISYNKVFKQCLFQ